MEAARARPQELKRTIIAAVGSSDVSAARFGQKAVLSPVVEPWRRAFVARVRQHGRAHSARQPRIHCALESWAEALHIPIQDFQYDKNLPQTHFSMVPAGTVLDHESELASDVKSHNDGTAVETRAFRLLTTSTGMGPGARWTGSIPDGERDI